MADIWGKLEKPTSIQLTSSVPGKTITKSRIRQQVWDFLEDHDLVNFPRPVHKRIPNFKGAATAGQSLASLPEFKDASVVKVNPDKPQEEVRYQVLDHNKTLLVPTPRLKSGLFNLLENIGDNSKEHIRMLASRQGIDNHSKPLPLSYRTHVDVVVIGSVAVDKQGHRIGKGEGYADLEFAMGMTIGSITEETVVIATVHDCQLFDSLPEEIFGAHDITVDIIVTPTTIHHVENRLPKPTCILWDCLSVEKFKKIPVLKQMKDEEDRRTKIHESLTNNVKREHNDSARREHTDSSRREHNDSSRREHNDSSRREHNDSSRRETKEKPERGRKHSRGERKVMNDEKTNERNNNYRHDASEQKETKYKKPLQKRDDQKDGKMMKDKRAYRNGKDDYVDKPPRKENNNKDSEEEEVYDDRHLLYVGKIPRNTRVRDLKDALLEREVKAKELVWKGFKGYAFLYFDAAEDIEKLFESLKDLKVGDKPLDIQHEKYQDDE